MSELQKNPVTDPVGTPTPAPAPVAAVHSPGPGRRRSLTVGEAFDRTLTSKTALIAMGVTSLALVAWGMVVQLPRASETRVVSAREQVAELQQKLSDSQNLPHLDQALLSNQVAQAERFLIQKRDDIVPVVTEMERLLKVNGLKGQVSVKPPVDRLSPVDSVVVHPGTIRLEPMTAATGTPYQRLVTFLDRLDQIPQKVEVVGMSVAAEPGGRFSAQLDLQLWVRKQNEKSPAK